MLIVEDPPSPVEVLQLYIAKTEYFKMPPGGPVCLYCVCMRAWDKKKIMQMLFHNTNVLLKGGQFADRVRATVR